MRIVIDASSALVRSAGVKSYAYHWVRSLKQAGAPVECFPYLRDWADLHHDRSPLSSLGTLGRLAILSAVNRIGSPVLDLILGDADIFHCSNLVRRVPSRARLTGTIHDLTTFFMPEVHTSGNIAADKNFADHILKRAHGLIAVSENTRQDAIRHLGIAPGKIVTIHSGIPPEFFDAVPTKRTRPYVLFVGTIEPRKNLNTLLDAWKALPPSLRSEFDLVVAGPMGWGSEKLSERLKTEATYLGYVPEGDLPSLTAGASLFVYPSLYEGFGFPVVQAMAAGVPVITSNTSCLPEIAGDAALLVDPRSVAELSGSLKRALESETLRLDLSARGRARAELYRWESCAQKSLDFFRKLT